MARLRSLALRFAASPRAFVTLARQNVKSSLRRFFSVWGRDFAARILVALTARSSSAQAPWKASM